MLFFKLPPKAVCYAACSAVPFQNAALLCTSSVLLVEQIQCDVRVIA